MRLLASPSRFGRTVAILVEAEPLQQVREAVLIGGEALAGRSQNKIVLVVSVIEGDIACQETLAFAASRSRWPRVGGLLFLDNRVGLISSDLRPLLVDDSRRGFRGHLLLDRADRILERAIVAGRDEDAEDAVVARGDR